MDPVRKNLLGWYPPYEGNKNLMTVKYDHGQSKIGKLQAPHVRIDCKNLKWISAQKKVVWDPSLRTMYITQMFQCFGPTFKKMMLTYFATVAEKVLGLILRHPSEKLAFWRGHIGHGNSFPSSRNLFTVICLYSHALGATNRPFFLALIDRRFH